MGKRQWLFVPAALLGVMFFASQVKQRDTPTRRVVGERMQVVRVLSVPQVALLPQSSAFGYVRPGRVWQAVAEVSGKVQEIHPDLKKGAILPKGVVLARVDAGEYQLIVARLEAAIRGIEAKIAERRVFEENNRATLALEAQSLALAQKAWERRQKLAKAGTASQADLDKAERDLLLARKSVQILQNSLALLPTERRVLEAEKNVQQTQLEQAKLDLKRTVITAPFDLRVAETHLEKSQFISRGQVLVVGDGLDVAEVKAPLSLARLSALLPPQSGADVDHASDLSNLHDLLKLDTLVRLWIGHHKVEWPARFVRISDTIDVQTHTVGLIVAVNAPYRDVQPGVRPPLAKGMFVEVLFRGQVQADQLVVPRSAVHDGKLYLVDAQERLEIRPVTFSQPMGSFVVVSGVQVGEQVVVSDLSPALHGMKLQPVLDQEALDLLVLEATGKPMS